MATFACCERCDSNSPCQSGLPATDIAQELEPIVPTPSHGEAAGSTAPAPSVDEAVDTTQSTGSPTFETGDPSLLIGGESSRRRQRDQQVVFLDMRSFQEPWLVAGAPCLRLVPLSVQNNLPASFHALAAFLRNRWSPITFVSSLIG